MNKSKKAIKIMKMASMMVRGNDGGVSSERLWMQRMKIDREHHANNEE